MLKVCIAGKNSCAIRIVSFLEKKISKNNILILPNISDKGTDGWQPSLRKYAKKKKIKIVNEKKLYNLKNLIFISIEYEKIIRVKNFLSRELFNIHFSILPKYRGCHTNYLQIKNGEKFSGVTLHKIDNGIDTGDIVDQMKYTVGTNVSAFANYQKLMKYSEKIFIKNYKKILKKTYKQTKQNSRKSSYFSRKFVNYKKEKNLRNFKNSIKFHNFVRALIFPPFQLPIFKKKEIIKSIFKNKKVYLKYL